MIRLPVATIAVLALAAVALSDVDVTVENADKIQGSVLASESVDTYRIVCPAGASLKVKAKGKKRTQLDVDLIPPGVLVQVVRKANTTTIDETASSGVYQVAVRSAGGTEGDYALSISFKTPKKSTQTVTLGAGESVVPFSVEAGTVLQVKASAAKGSAAVPRLLRLEGPGDFDIALGGVGKTASDSLGKTELPADGDYRLYLDDTSGTGGDVAVALKRKQPKAAKRKLDLRARAIGSSNGERLAVSEVIGASGGAVGVAFPGDGGPDSVIGGSNVVVPAGALTSPVPIVVATASDVKPKGKDGGAGPSVFFGPEGLSFATDVDVTVPVDLEQFQGDFTALRVYTRDARGKVSLVPGPYDVDVDTGTCTFQVAHFSSFRAARAGAGAASDVVGVWREVNATDPEFEDAFLVIASDGRVDTVVDLFAQQRCIISNVLPGGSLLPLEQLFQIVNGRLRFVDDQDDPDRLEYVRASPGDLPTGCDQL